LGLALERSGKADAALDVWQERAKMSSGSQETDFLSQLHLARSLRARLGPLNTPAPTPDAAAAATAAGTNSTPAATQPPTPQQLAHVAAIISALERAAHLAPHRAEPLFELANFLAALPERFVSSQVERALAVLQAPEAARANLTNAQLEQVSWQALTPLRQALVLAVHAAQRPFPIDGMMMTIQFVTFSLLLSVHFSSSASNRSCCSHYSHAECCVLCVCMHLWMDR
jgi:hypothetical protein